MVPASASKFFIQINFFLLIYFLQDSYAAVLEKYHNKKAERYISEMFKRFSGNVELYHNFPNTDLTESSNTLKLNMHKAIQVALKKNKGVQDRIEQLQINALQLQQARHLFTPQLQGTINYIVNNSDSIAKNTSASQSLSISQDLGTGGDLSLRLSSSQSQDESTSHNASTSLSFNQPLLRGAGSVGRESRVQAHRTFLYQVRDFKTFIDNFLIQAISRYIGLINSKIKKQNFERKYKQDLWLYKRTLAFFEIGRINKIELLRANQRKHQSENDWQQSIQELQNQTELFKLFMNLSPETELVLKEFKPTYNAYQKDIEYILENALVYRLDYQTANDQLEDAKRHFKHAKRGLLPDLSLSYDLSLSESGAAKFDSQDLETHQQSAGIQLSLPLDQNSERLSYFRQKLNLQKQIRDFQNFKSTLIIDLKNEYRNIRQLESSINIQELILDSEKKRYGISQYRFQSGDVSNREVIEANDSLTQAINRLIDLHTDHYIAKLNLLKNIGMMDIQKVLTLLEPPS